MGFVRGRAGGGAIGYTHSSNIGMVPILVSFSFKGWYMLRSEVEREMWLLAEFNDVVAVL